MSIASQGALPAILISFEGTAKKRLGHVDEIMGDATLF